MSHTTPHHDIESMRPVECPCDICRSLLQAQRLLTAIPYHALNSYPSAAVKVVEASTLLLEAYAEYSLVHNDRTPGEPPTARTAPHTPAPPFSMTRRGTIASEASVASPGKENQTTPLLSRRDTNPRSVALVRCFSPSDAVLISDPLSPITAFCSPAKTREQQSFEDTVRARAAELGILRGQSDAGTASSEHENRTPTKEKSKFIVCDHCRSHGIRCNEASVCKECILREVPCTHRRCALSPDSRAGCPRQVCFYVHGDWMPDIYGRHNPSDDNWIVLPGQLRQRLSMGKLEKQTNKTEAEAIQCYGGVSARQKEALEEMGKCVESGLAQWDSIEMSCKCVELEEQEKSMLAEQALRRLALTGGGSIL